MSGLADYLEYRSITKAISEKMQEEAMAVQIEAGHSSVAKLAEALGLDGRPIRKLVIEADCAGATMIYIVEYMDRTIQDGLVNWLKEPRPATNIQLVEDVQVSDKGEVTATPLGS